MHQLTIGLCVIVLFFGIVPDVSALSGPNKISIEDFARAPRVQDFSLSPDGKGLLYQERKSNARTYVVSQVDENGLTEMSRHSIASDTYISGAFWISNEKLFGYDVRFQGALPVLEEEPHISAWVMNADGSDHKILWEELPNPKKKKRKKGRKRKPAHKVSFALLHTLPFDSDHILLSRVEQTPDKRDGMELDVISDVFKMNIHTGDMRMIIQEHGIEDARMFSWVPDHKGIIRMGYGVIGEGDDEEPVLLVRKDANSPWIRLHNNELFKRGKFLPINFGDDPDILYVASSLATGRYEVHRFSINRGRLRGKVFAHRSVDVDNIYFSHDRSKLVAASYYDDEYRIEFFDDDFRQRMDKIAKAVGSKNLRLGSADQKGNRQIIWVGDERSIGTAWLYFEGSAKVIPLPTPAPWINPERMAQVQSVTYRARDGVDIPAYLTLPTTTDDHKNLPTILMPHGGPYVRDYKIWDYWTQFLANRGYAVLQPNFRGSIGYGERFTALGYGQWGDDMQQDLADGAKWLVEQGTTDAERICILGGSYGGYAALMGLIQDGDIFRCGIAWAPVTDLKQILVQDNMWDEEDSWYWKVTGGRSTKELKKISPKFMVDEIRNPLLMMHGDQDDVVFVDQSRWLAKAIKKKKKSSPYNYIEFAGLGHQLETEDARIRFLNEVEKFLLAHNPTDDVAHADGKEGE